LLSVLSDMDQTLDISKNICRAFFPKLVALKAFCVIVRVDGTPFLMDQHTLIYLVGGDLRNSSVRNVYKEGFCACVVIRILQTNELSRVVDLNVQEAVLKLMSAHEFSLVCEEVRSVLLPTLAFEACHILASHHEEEVIEASFGDSIFTFSRSLDVLGSPNFLQILIIDKERGVGVEQEVFAVW